MDAPMSQDEYQALVRRVLDAVEHLVFVARPEREAFLARVAAGDIPSCEETRRVGQLVRWSADRALALCDQYEAASREAARDRRLPPERWEGGPP